MQIKKKNLRRRGIRILLIVVSTILIFVIGLIINNRICYWLCSDFDNIATELTEQEIETVQAIYNYIDQKQIFNEFTSQQVDLIIYNKKFEFLFSSQQEGSDWDYLNYNADMKKYLYRRVANNSQAFAVKVDNRWVGSFPTYNYYNQSIIDTIGVIIPPQLFSADKDYYRGIVIHEMVHAYQGNLNNARVDEDEHLHEIGSAFYNNKRFNNFIKEEGEYLEKAIRTEDKELVLTYIMKFLETRANRRVSCDMSEEEISAEKELEWLEGIARYAEYIASEGTKSIIGKNLGQITKKVGTKNDDRYYTTGMAQMLILQKLNIDFEDNIFTNNITLEECLQQYSKNKQ